MLLPSKCIYTIFASSAFIACTIISPAHQSSNAKSYSLVGVWRANVQFVDGPYAAVNDLKFLISINDGGTLVESSNYDQNPPVPPAYGIWRKTGQDEFELRYEYFNSKAPKNIEDITDGSGWTPGGLGVLKEKIKLSADGNSYTSTIIFTLKDENGKPAPGSGKAICKGERMKF